MILFITGAGLAILQWGKKEAYPPYSSYSTTSLGTKGAYLLLEDLNFSLSRFHGSIDQLPDREVLITVKPDIPSMAKNKEILLLNQWVEKGNTLVLAGNIQEYFAAACYLDPRNKRLQQLRSAAWDSDKKDYRDVPYGRGIFRLVNDVNLFTNEGLENKGNATRLAALLWDFHSRSLLMNEIKHQGTGQEMLPQSTAKISPLDLISTPWKLILLQMLMGLGILAIYSGKRFGAPILHRAGTEREENEDTLVVGRLMERAELREDALRLYYQEFAREAGKYLKINRIDDMEMLEWKWKEKGLKREKTLSEIHACIKHINSGSRVRNETLIKAFQRIDALREELDNR